MILIDITLVLLIALGCYASAKDELKQTFPEDGICLGDIVTYSCVVNADQLVWWYTIEGKTISHDFFYTDPLTETPVNLGPFELVHTIIVSNGSAGIIKSTATSKNGLTVAENGAEISCLGTVLQEITILFAMPDITDLNFCMDTIYWIPPLCDANCTISVDGQHIGTIQCSIGNLGTNVSDLSNKTVMVTATDEIGNSRNIATTLTSENCTEIPIPTTEISITQMPSNHDMTTVKSSDASTNIATAQSPAASSNIAVILGVAAGFVVTVSMVVIVTILVCYYWHKEKCWNFVPLEEDTVLKSNEGPDACTTPLKLFSVKSKCVHHDHKHPITHCVVSSDAKYIFTADTSGTVRKWEPDVKRHSEVFYSNTDHSMNTSASATADTEKSTTMRDGTGSTLDDDTDLVEIISQEVCDESANINSSSVEDETISDINIPLSEIVEARDSPEGELLSTSKEDIKTFSPSKEDVLISLNWNSAKQQLLLTSKNCVKTCDASGSTIWKIVETRKRFYQLHNYKSILCATCNESTFAVSYTTDITKEPLTGDVVLRDMQKPSAKGHTVTEKGNPADVCMSFSPSGDFLATGNVNGVIKVYEMNVQPRTCHSGKVHEDVVVDIQFDSNDEKHIFSVGKDGKFALWNSTQGLLMQANFSIHPNPKSPVIGISTIMSVRKQVVFPSICRSKLFALGFANEYILASSEKGGILYKIDRRSLHLKGPIKELTEELIKELHCGKPVTCVDCVTSQDSETTTCVMGFADNSVKVVKLKCNVETQIRDHQNVECRSGGDESSYV